MVLDTDSFMDSRIFLEHPNLKKDALELISQGAQPLHETNFALYLGLRRSGGKVEVYAPSDSFESYYLRKVI